MKPIRMLLPAITGILGLLLGLTLAPSLPKPGNKAASLTTVGSSQAAWSSDSAPDDPKSHSRTRARERVEDNKPKEPRVTIPLKTMVGILKENEFKNGSEFDRLSNSMEQALRLLGATDREREEVLDLVKKSREDIYAAEKSHLKLGEVTAEQIHIDLSGMQGPAEEITKRTQDGIRAALPPELAEGLLSAIAWEDYYSASQTASTILEITRSRSGKLTAWQRFRGGGSGQGIGGEFKDDGTPLPADQIFAGLIYGDRWVPFLKGVTILPKDED